MPTGVLRVAACSLGMGSFKPVRTTYGFCKVCMWATCCRSLQKYWCASANSFKHQLQRDSTDLLASHAVPGCDTVSLFARYGKETAWKAFKQINQPLTSLGSDELTDETLSSI